jgi:Spy/CpxP family protein refolding chaperone
MKRGWFTYLMAFSLALNLGTAGALAYHHYQERQQADFKMVPPMPLRELWSVVKLDQAQHEAIQSLLTGHRRLLSETRQDLAKKRQELFALMASNAPLGSAIQTKVREISDLQERLEQEIVRFLLKVKQHLKPEQEAAFLTLVQGRLCGYRGGGDHHFAISKPGLGRGRGAGSGLHIPPRPLSTSPSGDQTIP